MTYEGQRTFEIKKKSDSIELEAIRGSPKKGHGLLGCDT
jgi:hypothetical protein